MRVSALWCLGPYSAGKLDSLLRHMSPQRPQKSADLLSKKGQPSTRLGGDNKGNIYQLRSRSSKELIFTPRYLSVSLLLPYSVALEEESLLKYFISAKASSSP